MTRRVTRWWTREPAANIGLRTGVIFDVVDLDTRAAMAAFERLAHEHGLDLATVPRTRTGGGGRHLMFEKTGVGNRADLLPDVAGVDWRGTGGYIVAPPSVHPSGRTYEWLREPDEGGFPVVPGWLLDQLAKPATDVLPMPAGSNERPRDAYVERALRGELDAVRAAREGARNHTLNRGAFALGQLVGAGWVPQHVADAELRAAAFACGLMEPEVSRTIRSGLEAGQAEPRPAPADSWGAGAIRGLRLAQGYA